MILIYSCHFFSPSPSGVWRSLWWWNRLHSASGRHAFYAIPRRGVHPRRFSCSPARTATPATSGQHHRSDRHTNTSRVHQLTAWSSCFAPLAWCFGEFVNVQSAWFNTLCCYRDIFRLPGGTSQLELHPGDWKWLVWPGMNTWCNVCRTEMYFRPDIINLTSQFFSPFTSILPDQLFIQVLLSEMYTDPGGVRVVVKELKANANGKEQNDFLQQGDPYRWENRFYI